ncbi:NTP transferase domain-containing protein [Flavitalea flava]
MNNPSGNPAGNLSGNPAGNLLGVVLCGGESRRMGRDKGLLKKGGIPWVIYMRDKLASHQIPVVFSISQLQWELYSAIIPSIQLIVDAVSWPGPMKGLISAHKKNPDKDLLLLSCDLLDLDEMTIRRMICFYQEEREDRPDFFVYQGTAFAQPFCGIYTAQGITKFHALYEKEDQQDFSFQRLLKKGNTRTLLIEREEAFRNYNSL